MDKDQVLEIKKLALIAMFSDDELMGRLVLKGGNVLDIVYDVAFRASADLDFSIQDEFARGELDQIESRIREVLQLTFRDRGYVTFDIRFTERPLVVTPDMRDFWGGYRIEFKVIEADRYALFTGKERNLGVYALDLGPGHRKAFRIDISKFEYCQPKRPRDVDGCTVYVYSPEMLVFEKLRAICQQMPEYREYVKNPSQSARARDFYDIYTILESFHLNLLSEENTGLLTCIFQAKRVPLSLIGRIPESREFHRVDFTSVRDTVKPGRQLKDFDFYFDYVVNNCCERLEPFWNV